MKTGGGRVGGKEKGTLTCRKAKSLNTRKGRVHLGEELLVPEYVRTSATYVGEGKRGYVESCGGSNSTGNINRKPRTNGSLTGGGGRGQCEPEIA